MVWSRVRRPVGHHPCTQIHMKLPSGRKPRCGGCGRQILEGAGIVMRIGYACKMGTATGLPNNAYLWMWRATHLIE